MSFIHVGSVQQYGLSQGKMYSKKSTPTRMLEWHQKSKAKPLLQIVQTKLKFCAKTKRTSSSLSRRNKGSVRIIPSTSTTAINVATNNSISTQLSSSTASTTHIYEIKITKALSLDSNQKMELCHQIFVAKYKTCVFSWWPWHWCLKPWEGRPECLNDQMDPKTKRRWVWFPMFARATVDLQKDCQH